MVEAKLVRSPVTEVSGGTDFVCRCNVGVNEEVTGVMVLGLSVSGVTELV